MSFLSFRYFLFAITETITKNSHLFHSFSRYNLKICSLYKTNKRSYTFREE
nr:MAG TPA: hypothetical protein [Caudoviricetes sp.]DAM97831.1 MAG TPA: hypothetical protein [Caudoviricetes sp.]